ncbi:integral membrane sensor signal transduction histidine kinase [Paenibacillus curdlanolyticus YK9]|uniref:histidine kinase n=1 Tax=Paenibacillus curdlanolyticus YK9 TaxID=717606 RepID=E0IAF3_9BACL|nr:HAMP domain-containing sensor histidine kinase [Paenibacillus curdlanolyticus]EFM10730.1 integral membrane sensor signal transduction histidine kinase [Paenibacillus curdlanolyticus YK9]
MSIRLRLLLSFTAVLAVAIILFMTTSYLISVAITGDMRSISSFYSIHYSLHPLTDEEETIFLDLKYLAKQDPDSLTDDKLLAEYDRKLKMVKAGLVVRHDGEVSYTSPSLGESAMGDYLPPYDAANNAIRSTLNVGNRFFSYAKFDFPFQNGKAGSIYVLRERSPFPELVRTLLPILVLVLLAIMLLTGLLLYRNVTKTIIRPLDVLRRSAEQIKEGDLQFKLEPQSRDEIGQLSLTFEQMRQKLNESIQLQLQYEDNRKQLISNISHDLKTPITTIKGYVEGIRDGLADSPEKLDKYVGTIYAKVTDMGRLVDELLLYSKLDLRREPYSFERVDLAAFIEDAVEESGFELEEQGIRVTLEGERLQDTDVMADRQKLRRVLGNLIQNSVKFMDKPDRSITLRLREEGRATLVVEVTDNGAGIADEALPHIFERFYRAEASRNSRTGGSGLGLAIAKQIIEGHGGTIEAESQLGAGTTMRIRLRKADVGAVASGATQRETGDEA